MACYRKECMVYDPSEYFRGLGGPCSSRLVKGMQFCHSFKDMYLGKNTESCLKLIGGL